MVTTYNQNISTSVTTIQPTNLKTTFFLTFELLIKTKPIYQIVEILLYKIKSKNILYLLITMAPATKLNFIEYILTL